MLWLTEVAATIVILYMAAVYAAALVFWIIGRVSRG